MTILICKAQGCCEIRNNRINYCFEHNKNFKTTGNPLISELPEATCLHCEKRIGPFRLKRTGGSAKFCSEEHARFYSNSVSNPYSKIDLSTDRPKREYKEYLDDEDVWIWINNAEQEAELALKAGEYFDAFTCTYCGEPSECSDHLLPRNWTGEVYRHYTPTVESCNECNGILSGFFMPSIWQRSHYIAKTLHHKQKDFLSASWTDHEIEQLGHGLSGVVQDAEKRRRVLLKRLRILESGGLPGVVGLLDIPFGDLEME